MASASRCFCCLSIGVEAEDVVVVLAVEDESDMFPPSPSSFLACWAARKRSLNRRRSRRSPRAQQGSQYSCALPASLQRGCDAFVSEHATQKSSGPLLLLPLALLPLVAAVDAAGMTSPRTRLRRVPPVPTPLLTLPTVTVICCSLRVVTSCCGGAAEAVGPALVALAAEEAAPVDAKEAERAVAGGGGGGGIRGESCG